MPPPPDNSRAALAVSTPTSSNNNSLPNSRTPSSCSLEDSPYKPASNSPQCTYHPGHALDTYCKIHEELLCFTCACTRHMKCQKNYVSQAMQESEDINNGRVSSPFQGVEEAAQELRKQILAAVAPASEAQEQELRTAADQVRGRMDEVQNQLSGLILQLETDRDRIIEAATRRCQQHVDSLRELAKHKTQALKQQYDALVSEAQAIGDSRVDALETVNSLDVNEQPAAVEMVQTCLRLSRQSSQKFEEPVEKANLCVALPPKDQLLEEIKGRGSVGSLDIDPSQICLKGPASVYYVGDDMCLPFTLETRGQHGEVLEVPDDMVVAGARVKTKYGPKNRPSIVVPVSSDAKKGKGVIELPLKVSDDMVGREVELDATVGGQSVRDSPKRVLIFKDPLGSAILVTPQHIRQLRSLLDFLPGKAFRLLYRATRDGFAAQEFHQRCDNQGSTLILCKTRDEEGQPCIFGGYTSQPWESPTFGRYKTDPSAFLFSLANKEGLEPIKLVSTRNHHQAMYCKASYGPTFGGNFDLHICDQANAAGASSYSSLGSCFLAPPDTDSRTFLGGCKSFSLEELEVYRVMMKPGRG